MNKFQVPTRVVMNNRTVAIFAGEDYDSQILTFRMEDTVFSKSAKESCFVLFEPPEKKAELCPFGMDGKTKTKEEWDYDFNLFKYQCRTKRDTIKINHDFQKKLDDKIKNAKKEMLDEQENAVKKHVQKKEEEDLKAVVKNTNKIALQAIQKELNLEAMIKSEEADREQREELEMMKAIEQEKKKSECLLKAIKQRQMENQYNLRAKAAEAEIAGIKQAATQQVSIRRSQLKNQIADMRKKYKRRKSALSQQLMGVRNVMAQNMGKAYKKGNAQKCLDAQATPAAKTTYCSANYPDDYSQLQSCNDGDDFCMLCCDNEFGDMFVKERQACYASACPKAGDTPGNPAGRWIWQTHSNTSEEN